MRVSRVGATVSHRRRASFSIVGFLTLLVCSGCAQASRTSGRPWTIQCLEAQGAERVARLEQVAHTLRQTPGARTHEVTIRTDSDGTARLCHGVYYRRVDSKTGKWTLPQQLRDDLQFLRELVDPGGRRYFFHALPIPMPLPDVGNPDWALTNVREKYSLQVAAFEPTDEFWEYKTAAAEYCKALREKGYEAYYHHSPASSVVTVGSFDDNAVRVGTDGRTYYSAEVLDLQRDELLKYNLVNGAIYKVKDPDGRSVPVPSRLIEVPRPTALP